MFRYKHEFKKLKQMRCFLMLCLILHNHSSIQIVTAQQCPEMHRLITTGPNLYSSRKRTTIVLF